jgi:hypothetical protein
MYNATIPSEDEHLNFTPGILFTISASSSPHNHGAIALIEPLRTYEALTDIALEMGAADKAVNLAR